MANIQFKINGKDHQYELDPSTPLLWVLRDHAHLVGTKFGCGISECGACTVHINGMAMRSCSTPVSTVAGKSVTTIEGLSAKGDHPVQKAWLKHDVPQCGYCQSGQMMSAASLLSSNSNPTDDEIDAAMDGNICRCGTYIRVKAAIKTAAKSM